MITVVAKTAKDHLKETARRMVRYALVALIPVSVNAGTFLALLLSGVTVEFATGLAFLVGGQVAFWSHDRLSFGDRYETTEGWPRRWRWLMIGQLLGFLLNWLVANSLAQIDNIYVWVIYVGATAGGSLVTFSWANLVSHKESTTTTCPADSARELAHQ